MMIPDAAKQILDAVYSGQILQNFYSQELKDRVMECIVCYQTFEKTGNPAIPYISAWKEGATSIWYEYTSSRFRQLLESNNRNIAENFRNSIVDRRIYAYPELSEGIYSKIIEQKELNGIRKKLREQGKTTGIVEAVYKLSLRSGDVIWLKDQATIESHEKDGVCLSLGCLTIVSKEMEAENDLKKHRDHLGELVKEGTTELTKANEKLKQEILERGAAEKKLQQSYHKLQNTMDGIIQAMSLTVEERDPYTAGHQKRAAGLAVSIAERMGLADHQTKGIQMAGLIHDMGKISIPAGILSKPGKLNSAEFELFKRHPNVAYEILKGIEFPWPVDEIVLQHHERMDGSGYPLGLSGEETLLEAKILSVADVVEAIASHRPYRPGLGADKALNEISRHKGILYDPNVVDACLGLFEGNGFQFDQ